MTSIPGGDQAILRDLARRVADIAALPVQAERRALWKQHNSLKPVRPMILIFPEGSWQELLPQEVLECESDQARQFELALRRRIYTHEHFQDDTVAEREWIVHKVIHSSGWGLEPKRISSPEARGAWRFDPVIRERADLDKLRFPEIMYDERATEQALEQAQDL